MNPERQPYSTQDAEGDSPETLMERVNANAAQGMTGAGSHEAGLSGSGQPGDGKAERLLEENGFQWLGGQLRDMYQEVVHEPLPDQFMDLLQKLDERATAAPVRPALTSVDGTSGADAVEDAGNDGIREEKH
jgi:hypothetical protein